MRKLTKHGKLVLIYVSISVLLFAGVSSFFLFGNSGKLVIHNLGIEMSAVGDTNPRNNNIGNFFGFGMPDTSGQIQSCFKYFLKIGTPLIAPCDGVVRAVLFQGSEGSHEGKICDWKQRNIAKREWIISNYRKRCG